jgi:hypothetical protein
LTLVQVLSEYIRQFVAQIFTTRLMGTKRHNTDIIPKTECDRTVKKKPVKL